MLRTNVMEARLDTGHNPPAKLKQYKTPLALQAEMKKQIDTLLQAGTIVPSQSSWASPSLLVKKNNGSDSYRLVIDYRNLNSKLT